MNAAIAHALAVFVQQTFVGHAPPPEAVGNGAGCPQSVGFCLKGRCTA